MALMYFPGSALRFEDQTYRFGRIARIRNGRAIFFVSFSCFAVTFASFFSSTRVSAMPSSPPNATSPPNNAPCSLPRSRENSNSPEIDSRRPSLKYIFAPLSQKAVKVTTPSTNKIILDYLLYLSIQSRLKQAHVELMELSTPLPENENSQSIEERKKRWMETARKAEQDKNAVEAIVAGTV